MKEVRFSLRAIETFDRLNHAATDWKNDGEQVWFLSILI